MKLNAVDWLLLVLIAAGLISGCRQGFIRTVGGLVSVLLGIAAGVLCWEPVTVYLQDNYAAVSLAASAINRHFPIPVLGGGEGMIPSLFKGSLYAFRGLDYHIARLLVGAVSFLVVMMLVIAATRLLWHLISLIVSGVGLGIVDRAAGGVLGAGKVILLAAVAAGVLVPLVSTTSQAGLPAAAGTDNLLRTSLFVPCLESLFQFMGKLF